MEESIGERILVYALGQYLGGRDVEGPLWGLLYLSENALHFQHFPQQNWFSAFLKVTGSGGTTPKEQEVVYRIRLKDVEALDKPRSRGFFQQLLFARDPVFALNSVYDSVEPFRFTIENRRSQFISTLEQQLGQLKG